ncbi:MAG: hypothetical protein ACLGSA_16120 [Acidobacteriota bacterium]
MPEHKDFFDDFYTETMSEMAGNFFSRRKEMEARLAGFARLTEEVRRTAIRALRRWGTFFTLLVDEEKTLAFLASQGVQADGVPSLAAAAGDPWRFNIPYALTEGSRYRKSVRYAYQAMRQATLDYREGCYGADARNPRKKILLPHYDSLVELATVINKEVLKINSSQSPSSILAYVKTLDPALQEREFIAGGPAGADMGKMDRELAFEPVDFAGLGLPELVIPPSLDAVQDGLDDLSDDVFSTRREDARRALAYVRAR